MKKKIISLIEKVAGGFGGPRLWRGRLTAGGSVPVEVFASDDERNGHYSTNVAFRLAKIRKQNPMEIATMLAEKIEEISPPGFLSKIEAAAPGFVNFWIAPSAFQGELKTILKMKGRYGRSKIGGGKKIQIEFISANPTGPLTVGNGRGGFLGDALANILNFCGWKARKEYYINDAKSSAQIRELGKTALGRGTSYLTEELAEKIKKIKLKKGASEEDAGSRLARELMKENRRFIEKELKIKFDVWFSEESLYESGAVRKTLEKLKKNDLAYEKDGAWWFRASRFGDTEDRVLVRNSGEPTYFLPDLAYHLDKFKKRKFDEAIDIWGADHYGYAPRLKAGLKALGVKEDGIRFIILQLVRLVKNGEEVRMSKRRGEFVTLKELIDEVGLDAARFFFLMYSPDTHMDFDLALAKERSLKNPVYYVQYAFVRILGILAKLKTAERKLPPKTDFEPLNTAEDFRLIRFLARFPEIVREAAESRAPAVLVRYLLETARAFHNFYEKERIAGEEKKIAAARLALALATKIVLENALGLLGVSRPKKM
ncbi:MAG: arginine--tRNA ligase [Parcubacteria group bacterium]|nr:arginine--tRNA ligase [Parcubacteria group bacterium]